MLSEKYAFQCEPILNSECRLQWQIPNQSRQPLQCILDKSKKLLRSQCEITHDEFNHWTIFHSATFCVFDWNFFFLSCLNHDRKGKKYFYFDGIINFALVSIEIITTYLCIELRSHNFVCSFTKISFVSFYFWKEKEWIWIKAAALTLQDFILDSNKCENYNFFFSFVVIYSDLMVSSPFNLIWWHDTQMTFLLKIYKIVK